MLGYLKEGELSLSEAVRSVEATARDNFIQSVIKRQDIRIEE